MAGKLTFGQWLHRQRRLADWTQRELADEAACATITIRKLEGDELRPSKQLAQRLAEVLGIPDEEVAGFVAFARGDSSVGPALGESPDNAPWSSESTEKEVKHHASIAVIPFTCLEPEWAHLAIDIAEEFYVALASVHWLFVTAPPSTESGLAPAVDYELRGSLHCSDARGRLSVHLASTGDNQVVWAQQYEGDAREIFGVMETLGQVVATSIEPRLLEAEVQRSQSKPAGDLDAYDVYLLAVPFLNSPSAQSQAEALRLLNRAILREEYAPALGAAALLHTNLYLRRPYVDPDLNIRRGSDFAHRSLIADRFDSRSLASSGFAIAILAGDLDLGMTLVEESRVLNPFGAQVWSHAGWLNLYRGDSSTAMQHFQQALRLGPIDPMAHRAYVGLAHCHIANRQLGDAQVWANRAVADNERSPAALRALAVSLALGGQIEDAKAATARLLGLYADSIDKYRQWTPFRHTPHHLELVIEGLSSAGFPAGVEADAPEEAPVGVGYRALF